MLFWRWSHRPRHPLARVLLAIAGLFALAGILALGFFALIAFAFIGTIVALTRAVARTHAAAAGVKPQADHPRVIEGEYVVVDTQRVTPQH